MMDVMAISGSKNASHHMQPGHITLLCTAHLAFKREKDNPLGLRMHGSYVIYLKKRPPLLCVSCVAVLSI